MVRAFTTRTRGRLALVLAMFAAYSSAGAEILARVDRDPVEQNESFTLEIIVNSTGNPAPDFSALETDFFVGQTSQLSNTRIVNGAISRSMTWTVALRARRAGTITIPAITVGNQQSNPVTIRILEPSNKPPGEADVFITSELDFSETYVQAQVLYTIKIYRAVATRQPALREPVFSGAEALVETVNDERSYEAILNGRAYNVSEVTYAVFPQESGEVQISPARFEARVLRDGRITGRKVFESEPQTITVNPVPPPPADYPNAAWLPARDLRLSEVWSRDPGELRVGEPISRHITVSALGQLETQIPVIEAPLADGVRIYPDKPSLQRIMESGGIRGERTDRYAMIGITAGEVTLPGLDLPWWDIDAGAWRVASLPAVSINVLPDQDLIIVEPPQETAVEMIEVDDDAEAALIVAALPWKLIAETLAAVLALTWLSWWWSSRPRREEREPPPVPLHKQQARHLKAARKAALAGDARGVRQALLDWGRLQWPDNPPRSVGRLAEAVSAPLSEELQKLSGISYGPDGGDWNGEALAKALRSFAIVEKSAASKQVDLLPPLLPKF
ncbi:MAG: protein BatD [Proteobacteria bacterium]|nr:protein BatD [Pseudomonadota bacterium]